MTDGDEAEDGGSVKAVPAEVDVESEAEDEEGNEGKTGAATIR
jgi:hypothetical protein